MVHCIYERVIKLKRNFQKLYIVFCCYCCCLHSYLLLQTFGGSVSIRCYYINICHRYRVSMATR